MFTYHHYLRVQRQVQFQLNKHNANPLHVIQYLLSTIKEVSQKENSRRSLSQKRNESLYLQHPPSEIRQLKGSRISAISMLLQSQSQPSHDKTDDLIPYSNSSKIHRKQLQKIFDRFFIATTSLVGLIDKITKEKYLSFYLPSFNTCNPLVQYWKQFADEKKQCKTFPSLFRTFNSYLCYSNFKKVLNQLDDWQRKIKQSRSKEVIWNRIKSD